MSLIRFKNSAFPSLPEDFFPTDRFENLRNIGNHFTPSANIIEYEGDFEIQLVAPGSKKENFQINLDENLLTISYNNLDKKEENNPKYIRKEFVSTSFKREFSLNQLIDTDNVLAKYENGILSLTLPKKEKAKSKEPRLIEIN